MATQQRHVVCYPAIDRPVDGDRDVGAAGDVPVPGNYDGDSFTDVAIWAAQLGRLVDSAFRPAAQCLFSRGVPERSTTCPSRAIRRRHTYGPSGISTEYGCVVREALVGGCERGDCLGLTD